MQVEIIKQFDNREVGTLIDLHESTAKVLIEKGIVKEPSTLENKIETKKSKKNEKSI